MVSHVMAKEKLWEETFEVTVLNDEDRHMCLLAAKRGVSFHGNRLKGLNRLFLYTLKELSEGV